jgi:FAD-dependent urate hydroxylase
MHARPLCEVAIVGAGPYGLSIAAHLARRGVAHRIFGQPMLTWQKMLRGSFLKSLGFATDIYLPGRRNNFVAYCRERGLESVEPCAMADFARFGIWTQSRAVPNLETVEISRITRQGDLFLVTTADHETFPARHVIVAVGLTHFAHIPDELAGFSAAYVTHTSAWSDFQSLAGQEICVIGAGASSLDAAAQLLDAGARPTLLVRGSGIGFSWKTPEKRSLWEKIRRPDSALGFGFRSWVFEVIPGLLHCLPDSWRIHIHRTHFGPLGGWWLRDRVDGKTPLRTHCRIVSAELRGARLALTIHEEGKGQSEIVCDHVIAGSGYRLDADRLPFLDDEIKRSVRRIEKAPALDWRFESSVPGLFFVGPVSSLSFGPLFRFVVGARYTARVLSRVLAWRQRKSAQKTSGQESSH